MRETKRIKLTVPKIFSLRWKAQFEIRVFEGDEEKPIFLIIEDVHDPSFIRAILETGVRSETREILGSQPSIVVTLKRSYSDGRVVTRDYKWVELRAKGRDRYEVVSSTLLDGPEDRVIEKVARARIKADIEI